jgi:hypothetical protein
MPRKDSDSKSRADLEAQLDWVEVVYTVVGIFWAGWAIAALIGIYTRHNVKLPLFGEVTFTEVVVYTLYAWTLGIPFLLALVFRHRSIQQSITGAKLLPRPHFPKLPIAGMPASFRTIGFIALVVLPIVAQEIAYRRLYQEVCIAWKPHRWWKVEDYIVILRQNDLFKFPSKPEPNRDYANWRFMRLDLPNWGVLDRKEREARPEDNDGRPPDAKQKEPVQISAFPGIAPWAFRISAHASAAAAAWLLVSRDGSLPRRVFAYFRRMRSRRRRTDHSRP